MSDLPPPPGGESEPLPPPPEGGMPPPPPPSVAPTQPVEPSSGGGGRGKAVAVVAALVVIAAAAVGTVLVLSGDDEAVELSDRELEDALLEVDDLDGDYTAVASDDEATFNPDDIEASDECIDLFKELESNENDSPGREYNPANFEDPSFELGLSSPYEGRPDFSVAGDIVDVCDEMRLDDGETVGTMTLERTDDISLEVGDESVAMKMEFQLERPAEATLHGYIVFWDRDGIYGTFQGFGGYEQTSAESFEGLEFDSDLVETYVRAADEKLAEVIEEAG